MQFNTTGSRNIATGQASLLNNVTGSFNTAYGYAAFSTNTTGSQNTGIGYNVDTGNFNGSLILGYNATATANNQCVFGSASVIAGAVTAALTPQANVWNVVINGVARQILLA